MSYLENGATHRSMFRLTPPLHHDVDPNRSQIVAYIMENTGWEVGRAVAAFNSMRNPRSRVLVFDKVHRVWKGCDWVPSKDNMSHDMILAEHRALERRVVAMDAELRKATREIAKLTKQVANLKQSSAAQDEQEEETQEEYNASRKAENEKLNHEESEKERIKAEQKMARDNMRNREIPSNDIGAMVRQAWS
jgi:Rad3-related DNA helicase